MSQQLASDAQNNPAALTARATHYESSRAAPSGTDPALYPDLSQQLHRAALWLAALLLCVILA